METHTDKQGPRFKRPALEMQTTTLWEYPSQNYGSGQQGSRHYEGATPSWVIWNCLRRYTRENDLVVDPMCGSGTTLDVCRDLGRRGRGFDLAPVREDVEAADARALPLAAQSVDFVFIDPPYSTHIEYSDHKDCIGRLDSFSPGYFEAMEQVTQEAHRVLKDRRYLALYVCDSYQKKKGFSPIGFELYARLCRHFKPADVICVVRHNRKLKRQNWHSAAAEGNFFLRGFNYLFLMKKESAPKL